MNNIPVDTAESSASVVLSSEEISEKRKERREIRKLRRQEERLKKKVDSFRTPQSEKLTVITKETFQRLQKSSNQVRVKNKLLKASQSTFALTDFLVTKQEKSKSRSKCIPGTIIPSLRRGKVREVPKKKVLSRLKRAVVGIREHRRKELAQKDLETKEQNPENNPVAPIPALIDSVDTTICHSRKFRSYCDHTNHPDIRGCAESLLSDLFRFQDRAYEKNQIKARAHRRYVAGFKEAERHLEIDKVKLLIIATDLEPNAGVGGLDETVKKITDKCKESLVPYCFPLQRRKIGYLLFKKAPISCVAILDYSGAEEHANNLIQLVQKNRSSVTKQLESLEIK